MVDISKLKQEQLKFAKKVLIKDEFEKVSLIGGCDQAFIGNKVISQIVVLDAKTLDIVEKAYAITDSLIPYIPTFSFFREGPAIIEAYQKLSTKPDVLLIDSNGILHPRRIGMASHVGVILDIPTIGVAKVINYGIVQGEDILSDKELVGKKVLTREFANPLYVSPGHKITLKSSVDIIRQCMKQPHKLPEPLHLAHRLVSKQARKMNVSESKAIRGSSDIIAENSQN